MHAAEATGRPVTVVQVGQLRTADEVVLATAAVFALLTMGGRSRGRIATLVPESDTAESPPLTRELIEGWDTLRMAIGLPAPLEYAAPVRDRFGLDPAAPPSPAA